MSGPLSGIRVVEMAGLGPGPCCAMVRSDLGVELGASTGAAGRRAARRQRRAQPGRRSLAVDLEHPRAVELVLDLVERSDVLLRTSA